MAVKGPHGFKKDGLLVGYDTGYGLTNYYGAVSYTHLRAHET